VQINEQTLKDDGFAGFRPFEQLDINRVPRAPGLYVVLKPEGFERVFLAKSLGARFKKRDPSLPHSALEAEWIENADILYIGKAGPGSRATADCESIFKSSLTSAEGSLLGIGAAGLSGSSPTPNRSSSRGRGWQQRK
jgi:hypothetical protein